MKPSEIKEEKEIPKERSLIPLTDNRIHGCQHRVINREIRPNNSSYPNITVLEAELMEIMGDSLGG